MPGDPLLVLHCISHAHDGRLVALAALICAIGVYAAFALAQHAARSGGRLRARWGAVSIVASGATAWATHFIVLLAFDPRMPAAFEPLLTAASLVCAVVGIGAGTTLALRGRRSSRRWRRTLQFVAGLVVGLGIATLHYVGQAAYLVEGEVTWNRRLVVASLVLGLPLAGLALVAVGDRRRRMKRLAAPLLLLSIATLHFCGMAAMTLRADPRIRFPADALSPAAIAPVVAVIALALIALAVLGWRFDVAARAGTRHDRRRLRDLSDVALEGLLICQGDTIVTANTSIERQSGHAGGTLSGRLVSVVLPGLDLADMPEREEREAQLLGADGQIVPVRVLRQELLLGRRRHTVIAVRDQRERLRTEAKIRHLAFSDPLTDLPNRTRFLDLLSGHAAAQAGRQQGFAVLMIDLDRFKLINDTLGHAAGDIVLRLVADRLRGLVRGGDLVARLGGDEFAIIEVEATAASAATLAARIVEKIAAMPFMLDGQVIHLGTSIGISVAPEDGGDPTELMRNADLALYAAKADGKNTWRRYDISLDEKIRARRALEAGLRLALAEGQLELSFQPLVDARTGRVTSAEALVRWHHPERGVIAPAEFIGLAEETGLILPLGEWVLRTACAEAAGWPEAIGVAVNLSPAQFREHSLIQVVDAALHDSGLPPGRLELEITEGVLLADERRTIDVLTTLRARGIRIAMDDFGTGYSSLSYLRKFPFDKIKIDQSFVRQVPDDADSVAIVRAIITMSACLGIATTVEGVETPEQFDFSVREGCDTIQGYHVSRPVARDTFAAFLRGSGAILADRLAA
jgi:diguanylate cyclase (GGDEF)-like protein